MAVDQSKEDESNHLNIERGQDRSDSDLLIRRRKRKVGGWSIALLLLGNQGLATLAFVGVEVNLVLFAKRVLQQPNADAANTFSTWMGTVNLFSLMGAFFSDAYWGRYITCAMFQFVLTTGLAALSLTTSFLLIKPQGCGNVEIFCGAHSSFELAMFYISIYMVALGSGGYEPCLAAFASDQFNEQDASDRQQSFFSYFYVATNLGSLISETILAYIENLGHWTIGFWISTCSASFALALLLSGTIKYRYFKPGGNPISRLCQVVVAAWRKCEVDFPLQENDLYDQVHGVNSINKLSHTKGLRFLDRAAIITSEEITSLSGTGTRIDPWHLCTVSQVEEVKRVLRLLPVWLCTITFSGIFIQMVSLFVEQGATMRASIHNFKIPPASMTTFDIISVSLFIMFYDKLIAPLYTRLTKRVPSTLSELKKIGVGLVIAIAGMVAAGLVEQRRRKYAVAGGDELSSLFILWQVPQYILVGIGEAFVYVGQYDFFSSQAPEGLKSVGIGLSMASISIGSYLCSLLLVVVMKITRKDGNPGWVPPNLNDGHLDNFFFLMAIVTAIELAIYTWAAKRYKYIAQNT